MKKAYVYFVFVFAIAIWSCNKNDQCDGIDCFTPPSPFYFELVDKSSRENLFTTGVLIPSDIKVVNLDDQSNAEFVFIDENDSNIIGIVSIGWETQIVNYSIEISSESIFTLLVDAESVSENCCRFTKYNKIEINGTDFELNEQRGVYQIMVE